MRPSSAASAEFIAAFTELVARIAVPLAKLPKNVLPIRMYVAGGAAMHLYTGQRISKDIDAAFSRRITLPEDLEVSYRDADGAARLLYFDRQYNDSFALMHEDVHDDSVALQLKGIDARVLDVRLLSAIDLAISKIARFTSQDRDDILSLARNGLVRSGPLRKRAEEAAAGFVGELSRLHASIELACRLVADAERRR